MNYLLGCQKNKKGKKIQSGAELKGLAFATNAFLVSFPWSQKIAKSFEKTPDIVGYITRKVQIEMSGFFLDADNSQENIREKRGAFEFEICSPFQCPEKRSVWGKNMFCNETREVKWQELSVQNLKAIFQFCLEF